MELRSVDSSLSKNPQKKGVSFMLIRWIVENRGK